jgi:phage terminase large subunit
MVTWENERVYLTELEGQQAFAIARTYNVRHGADEQAETLAGYHEDFMLYVTDEASAIPDPVFRPIEGSMTGICNIALVIFNPTRSTGYAIESQRHHRDDFVCLHWSSEDSELVPKENLERDLKRHGRKSNFYRIRRLGLPPISEKGALIPWEKIMEAVDRPLDPTPDDPIVMTLDVGAGGDDSALGRSAGPVIYPFETTSTADPNILTGWALRRLFDHLPRFVFVDITGYGWAVEGNLRARYKDGETIGVNVNTEARDKSRFRRLRDELWWEVRDEFINSVISIPDDPILIEELSAFHYQEDENGLIKVESKDDLAARGFDSPNRADCIMMRRYYTPLDVQRMKRNSRGDDRRDDPDVNWRTV